MQGKNKPTIGISCLHFAWNCLDEAFLRCTDEFSFDILELSTNVISAQNIAEIASLQSKYNLLLSLHGWEDLPQLGVDEGIKYALDLLNMCTQIKANYLILHFGTHKNREKGLQILRKILLNVSSIYAKSNVKLCLENHYPYEYHSLNELGSIPEDFLTVIDGIDSNGIGFCLDYGHANMSNNLCSFLQTIGRMISYVHIADNMGYDDDHLAYGEGNIDWDMAFNATIKLGFSGPFVIEFPESRGRCYIDQCTKKIRNIYETHHIF